MSGATLIIESVRKELLGKYMINKVLSTLWHYQKEYFKEDHKKGRWTFTVGRQHPEFPGFKLAIDELTIQGLIFYDNKAFQFGLSDRGIEFCKKHETDLNEADLFTF